MSESPDDLPAKPAKKQSSRLVKATLILERALWLVSLLAPFTALYYGRTLWGLLTSFVILFRWWRFGFYIAVLQPEGKRAFYLVEYGTVFLMCFVAMGISEYYGFRDLWTH